MSERSRRKLNAVAFGASAFLLVGACFVSARGPMSVNNPGREAALAPIQKTDMNNQIPSAQPPENLARPLASLIGNRPWLNTPPLRAEDLRGKVVLVNFWTYSCINSLRTLPYLRAWAQKYKDRGLVVIGVHTPEFAFEHDVSKVKTALTDLPVEFPVVLDSDYAVWEAFSNNAWPGFYFIGTNGRVRHRVLGEGRYEQSERWIQELLSEATGVSVRDPIVDIVGEGAQAAPDWDDIRTQETYAGFARAENFASPGGFKRGGSKSYSAPARLSSNHWGLSGS